MTVLSLPCQALQQAELYCRTQGLPFPHVEASAEDHRQPGECYLFSDPTCPEAPVLLCLPLVNVSFKDHSAPGEAASPQLPREGLRPGPQPGEPKFPCFYPELWEPCTSPVAFLLAVSTLPRGAQLGWQDKCHAPQSVAAEKAHYPIITLCHPHECLWAQGIESWEESKKPSMESGPTSPQCKV